MGAGLGKVRAVVGAGGGLHLAGDLLRQHLPSLLTPLSWLRMPLREGFPMEGLGASWSRGLCPRLGARQEGPVSSSTTAGTHGLSW